MFARVIRPGFPHEELEYLHGLRKPARALVDGNADGLELELEVGAPHAQAGEDATGEHAVERAHRLGEHHRMPERREHHRRAHLNALGGGENRRPRGEALHARLGQHAVAEPDGIETKILGLLR